MIYDVLDSLENELNDGTTGVNAQVTAVNAAKSESAPAVATVQVWGDTDGTAAKLPAEMTLPALVVSWRSTGPRSSRSLLRDQGTKRWATHEVTLHYFDAHHDQHDARKHTGLVAQAVLQVLDHISESGDTAGVIEEIRPTGITPTNWLLPNRGELTGFELEAQIHERDESA